MARVDTAPASQVPAVPPVFWIVLPLTITFVVFVHATASQEAGTSRLDALAFVLSPPVPNLSQASERRMKSRMPRAGLLVICMRETPSRIAPGEMAGAVDGAEETFPRWTPPGGTMILFSRQGSAT